MNSPEEKPDPAGALTGVQSLALHQTSELFLLDADTKPALSIRSAQKGVMAQ